MKETIHFIHTMKLNLNGKEIEIELSCESFDGLQDVVKLLQVYELLRMEELK